jgi:O-antigen ligase
MSTSNLALRLGRVPPAGFIGLVLAAAAVLGAIGAAKPEAGLALGVVAVTGVAALAWPEAATLLVVFLVYTNALGVAVAEHGAPQTVGALAPLLLMLPIAAALRHGDRLRVNGAFGWILGLLAVQAAATVLAVDQGVAAGQVISFISEGVVLYLLVYNAVRTPETLARCLWVILLAAGWLALVSAFQHFASSPLRPFMGFAQVDSAFLQGRTESPRLSGPLGDPNYYAQILLAAIPIGYVLCQRARSVAARVLAAGSTALCCVAIALTYSRGAAVGLAFVLVLMLVMRMVRLKHVLAVAAGLVIVVLLVPTYANRVGSLTQVQGATAEAGTDPDADQSAQGRTTEMLAAALAFSDRPLLGVGPGGFPIVYRTYAERIGTGVHETTEAGSRRGEEAQREAHNMFLSIAAELGLLGLVAFCGALWVTLRGLLRARDGGRARSADLATALLLSIVAYVGAGLFLTLAFERYFWLLLALAGAAASLAPRRSMAAAARRASPGLAAPARRALEP